ncbi:response regulator [Komarekiella sp. 'clone 1']|uniref:Response regulator n=1 Tax=Komarekiella delphini-convector SJRDD-AB1 TaxID=2593771 RepID=A0AA40VVS1_9NOST|nr:response regulator [Komarekiella delphini-convector]MBD6621169.1 response regulator [Komarekiella delphini-convector SJRDD-AB1]
MTAPIQQNQLLALIVDDEPFFRTVLRLFLEQDGYRVAEAENGTEAINVFEQLHPDIVLLDISMPDMDGFECCHKLHSLAQGQNTGATRKSWVMKGSVKGTKKSRMPGQDV